MPTSNTFSPHVKKLSTRDGYGEAVLEAGTEDERIVVLSADLEESTRSNLFAEKFPKRFFEVGVAEQNMAGIAAGMALSGKIPFMASYAVFMTKNSLAQIRLSIAFANANVKIVASHGGLSPAADGASHQDLEDIAVMRAIPNMTVLAPADYIETKKAVVAAIKHKGPVYLRLSKEKTPVFTTKKDPFKIGESQIVRSGNDVTIAATGASVYDALLAAHELKNEKNIECEVINCASIKPFDSKTLIASAKKTKKVITVEEHQASGGLGGLVCEVLSQHAPTPVKILAVKDTFTESGTYNELKDKYGVSTHHIKKAVFDFV